MWVVGAPHGTMGAGDGFDPLSDAPSENIVMLKLNYWLDPF